jgi:branched-chain amino acid transport system permease protein
MSELQLSDPLPDVEERPPASPDDRPWRARIAALVLVALSLLWVAAGNGFGTTTVSALLPVLTTAAIYATAGVGLNLQFGHGGLLNFGFVAFMAVGGYTTVLLIPHRQGPESLEVAGHLPLLLAVACGMVLAALLGALFGIPAVRLRSDYLAIVMIALAEILRIALRDAPSLTGGVFGVLSFSDELQDLRPGFLDPIADALYTQSFQLWLTVVAWLCLVVVSLAMAGLVRSPWGQLLRAVRDDEDAVRSLGKSPTRVKLQALMIGGAVGGLSGGLLAFQLAQVNPDIFLPQVTFFVFTVVILGGTGSTWGPAVGGVVFWVLLTQSGAFVAEHVGSGTVGSALRYILVGVLMVLLINFRPQGILGRREDVVLKLK